MYTASEICISAQTGRLSADQGDMHGVGVPTLKQYCMVTITKVRSVQKNDVRGLGDGVSHHQV